MQVLAACLPMWHSERQELLERSITMHAQAVARSERMVCAWI